MNKQTILIADSGATKTDWCLVKDGKIIHRFNTKGLSPVFQSQDEIANEIKNYVLPELEEKMPDAIFFYGSGCIPEKIESVKSAIQSSFPIDKIEVYSDLIAAAHALCGKDAGIACILGTGSNSCEWDGNKITKQISPLGFILGDEGSGAHLGKLLVGDVLKNQISSDLKDKFLSQYNLTPAIIIENVYRKPFPSRFLASVAPFLLENIEDESVKQIVRKSFGDFFERNVMHYNYQDYEVSFVGSIAHYYSPFLKEVANEKGIIIGKIYQSPMEGLIKYYNANSQ
jgi:N-acetylglucosamine kinase-like BadF-type ATPase